MLWIQWRMKSNECIPSASQRNVLQISNQSESKCSESMSKCLKWNGPGVSLRNLFVISKFCHVTIKTINRAYQKIGYKASPLQFNNALLATIKSRTQHKFSFIPNRGVQPRWGLVSSRTRNRLRCACFHWILLRRLHIGDLPGRKSYVGRLCTQFVLRRLRGECGLHVGLVGLWIVHKMKAKYVIAFVL